MIWVLLAIGGYLFLRGTAVASVDATASASPINNATGGSLSASLGNSGAAPKTFSTGKASGTQSLPQPSNPVLAGPSASSSPNPVRSGAGTVVRPGGHPIFRTGPAPTHLHPIGGVRRGAAPIRVATPIHPVVANRPPATKRNSPEIASAFWTKVHPVVRKNVSAKNKGWFSK